MNHHPYVRIVAVLVFCMLAFHAGGRVEAAPEQGRGIGASAEGLDERVARLEKQVADLQAQVKKLSSREAAGVLTLPGNQAFPGGKIPPGARQHEIDGIQYWTVPLGRGR